jgi:acylglycerol lipase
LVNREIDISFWDVPSHFNFSDIHPSFASVSYHQSRSIQQKWLLKRRAPSRPTATASTPSHGWYVVSTLQLSNLFTPSPYTPYLPYLTLRVPTKARLTPSQPDGPTKAKLIFIHGFSDHLGRYSNFFPALASRGIAVHGLDQRGWGRSVRRPADRGLTGPTSQVLADMAAFITPHLPSPSGDGADAGGDVPVFVMGHSMGGGQVLTFACHPDYQDSVVRRVRGWLLESPFIGFSPEEKPSALKVFAGRLAGRLFPHQQLKHEILPQHLSRDPEVVKSIAEDELMHNTGTLEGLAGLLDRTAALASGLVRPLPGGALRSLWIGHGTADKTTWFEASKRYFDECTGEVKDKEFRAYEGWYHQLHADGPDSEQFYRDVGDWILARCGEDKPEAKL